MKPDINKRVDADKIHKYRKLNKILTDTNTYKKKWRKILKYLDWNKINIPKLMKWFKEKSQTTWELEKEEQIQFGVRGREKMIKLKTK